MPRSEQEVIMPERRDRATAKAKTDKSPKDRMIPFLEIRAARLMPKGEQVPPVQAIEKFTSSVQPGRRGSEALAPLPPAYWRDVLTQFHKRHSQQRAPYKHRRPGEPGVPGQSNWFPIGPSV